MEDQPWDSDAVLACTAAIVGAYVSNNSVPVGNLPAFIQSVHGALRNLCSSANSNPEPAVPVRKSVTPDYLICLEDGKHLKMLKRHLRARYRLSPEGYRAKWNLPSDYPMVAPNYAAWRSQIAKKIGLGRAGRTAKHRKRA